MVHMIQYWRIRMNYELNKLIGNADMVRFRKIRRIAWLGHVMGTDDKRTPKKILQRETTEEMDCRH
jgi:hypothetical protein